MKRRLVKKWIKRYITPHIKDLPTTTMRGWERDLGNGIIEPVRGRNHTIKNGFVTPEGNYPPNGKTGRHGIIRAGQAVQDIRSRHEVVYLRISPVVYGKRLYMRLITD